MSLLQRTGVYQKTDHCHPAFTPSGVNHKRHRPAAQSDYNQPLPAHSYHALS
jgi:hypothetical protein